MSNLGLAWRWSLLQEYGFYFAACRNWQAVIQAHRRQTPLDCFALRAGPTMRFAGPPPFQILQEVWRKRAYDPTLWRNLPPPTVVVDIGANIGFFALYAAARWPRAQIWAYEPAPENVQWLRTNAQFAPTRLHLSAHAVAAQRGVATFYLKREAGWHSLYPTAEQSTPMEVETVTLAEVLAQTGAQHIDFLKLDCEGAEFEILAGQAQWLAQHVGRVALEYHEFDAQHRVRQLTTIFEQAGFHVQSEAPSPWHTGMLYAFNPQTFANHHEHRLR